MLKQLLNGLCLTLLSGCAGPWLSSGDSLLSGETETYCLGRHLVDMPVEAKLAIHEDRLGIARIVSIKGDTAELHAAIQETLAERNPEDKKDKPEMSKDTPEETSKADNSPIGYRLVETVFPAAETRQIIVSSKERLWHGKDYLIEAFTKPEGDYFFYLRAEFGALSEQDAKEIVAETISWLRELLPAIRYRPDDEFPSASGVCIQNGFIADNGKLSLGESVEGVFVLKKHPESVGMSLQMQPSTTGGYSLLKRQSRATVVERFPERKAETAATQTTGRIRGRRDWVIQRVRAGALTVNGLPGEESLAYFPSDDIPGIAHRFSWATAGEPGNPLKPFTRLDVITGQEPYHLATDRSGATEGVYGALGPSPLETRQVVKLYDAIVKTIRPRPGTGAAPVAEAAK